MKNKPCKAAFYTLLVGILLPLAVSLTYILCLWNSHSLNNYFFLQESLKVIEAFLGCVVFSIVCAVLWDYLYLRYEL
ncbi:MAG: hypothetical protein IJB65_04060 [Clostridia bacterium]|nr:hypothetical protein [Clostridia bacterium]